MVGVELILVALKGDGMVGFEGKKKDVRGMEEKKRQHMMSVVLR